MRQGLHQDFNPRAHAGRDVAQPGIDLTKPHFNPRAHAGRDGLDAVELRQVILISIHAPTRGATFSGAAGHGISLISIHAPTRGATCFAGTRRRLRRYFNPRAHAGRDSVGLSD